MCGICGFYSKQNITIEQLTEMNDTLYHRGPDDNGVEIYVGKDGYSIGLAQRRLSILDLSPLGHQPMHSADKRVSIAYNGEIYNFLELREELKDYPFKSHCDTEVILAAYLKWGISCVEKFNGMFAIALYDREDESLYLVRDRVGKKPLYYWENDDSLMFASELKPIMKYEGFDKKVRQELLNKYLVHQYINAPDTIFENVYKLEPGAVYQFQKGKKKQWKYWDIATKYQEKKGSFQGSFKEAKEELKKKLSDSIRMRMIADVPLGTFLSGGYDSSLMTAMAQSNSSQPVKTFSIGFDDKKYNEAIYAKEVAEYLGTEHTEMYIGEADMFALIESMTDYYDEPFADSSQIPTMLVSKLAKEKVTVALSGDGGDEFFCGYNNYKMLLDMQKINPIGALVYGACNLPGMKQLGVMEKLPTKVQIVAKNRHPKLKVQPFELNKSEIAEALLKTQQMPYRFEEEEKFGENNWQIRRMLLDMDTYLPGDILCKVDRASMKYSLETRCPILDKDVVEFSFAIPHEYKYDNGNKKKILKALAYDYIPREMLERPKVGFSVPLDGWLRGPLKEQLLDYCNSDFIKKQDIFEADAVENFMKHYLETGDAGRGTGANYSRFVWAYFVFQKWYQQYM
ncbi:MAG: asparagine synthase (glutamine-hydrolyzing) [Lachnospiraceae bacterium]|nr:asparagine synthase (glutamine-hydrolyzing) [Lachnospiraceae bacterium]